MARGKYPVGCGQDVVVFAGHGDGDGVERRIRGDFGIIDFGEGEDWYVVMPRIEALAYGLSDKVTIHRLKRQESIFTEPLSHIVAKRRMKSVVHSMVAPEHVSMHERSPSESR